MYWEMKDLVKLSSTILVLILMIGMVSAGTAISYYEEGSKYYAAGEYEKALNAFDKSLQDAPDKDFLWVDRGTTLFQLGRFEESLKSFDDALEVNQSNGYAWYGKAATLHALKKNRESLQNFETALTYLPGYALAWYGKATVEYDLEEYDNALVDYEKSITLEPSFASAWAGKGDVLYQKGQFSESVAAYDKALTYDPYDENAIHDRQNALKYLKGGKNTGFQGNNVNSSYGGFNPADIISLINEANFPITVILLVQILFLVTLRVLCVVMLRYT